MNISRRERSREKNIIRRNELLADGMWMLLATVAGLLWLYHYVFVLTMSMAVLLLGIVGMNYAHVRLFLPGIDSPFLYIRWSAALLYLVGIIAFISQVSLYTLLSYHP